MTSLAINERTVEDLGWPQVLDALQERTATERGKARAAALPFLDDAEQIHLSFARIEEARVLLRQDNLLPLGGVADVRAALERASKGAVLEPEVILACADLMRAAAQVRRFLNARKDEMPLLVQIGSGLVELGALAARIEASFEPSGELKDTASDALADYRSRVRQLHRQLKERIEVFLHDLDFGEYLQDSFFSLRNDRYVLPIKASFRNRVPGIVHNASQSGQTLFIEPQQVVDLGNELAIAESLVAEEERQVLAEFSSYIGDKSTELNEALSQLASLDVIQAAARLAEQMDAEPPRVADDVDGLQLGRVRHPLLLLANKAVVANDILLQQDERVLVVSGPNAGGKTVTITAVGLCSLMARAGLPIPAASGSQLPVLSGIASAIGDSQDLGRDLSTFSAHLTLLRDILKSADEGWLVIIDEIASDTDPKEGAALAAAVLEELCGRGVRVLVSTHLDEVKALGVTDRRFVNGRVGFDRQTFAPTYELELGAAGVSNAIEIARQVGLPPEIIDEARARLKSEGALSIALAQLENEHAAMLRESRLFEERNRELQKAREELEAAKEAATAARRDAEARVRQEMVAEVEAAKEEVRAIISSLQASPKMAEAQKAQKTLEARAAQASRQARRLGEEGRAREDARRVGVTDQTELQVGSRVRVLSLGQSGEVLALDGEAAVVAVGTMRTRVSRDDVVVVGPPRQRRTSGSAPRASRRRRPEDVAAAGIPMPETHCDVRGLRADEAAKEVEQFLDRCAYSGPNEVYIVHGHGTGALKRSVRELLERLPYVSGKRPGDLHEGGDGVTVVTLN